MKKYGVIYADPPWRYRNKPNGRSPESHYPTMPIEDIKALPVKDLAADDCILFLWVTFPQLKDAWGVMEAWGFAFKTIGFVWVKLNPESDGIFWGMGYWTRSNAEMSFPERFSGDWTGLNGSFVVHADAELVLPEGEAMPVASVSRKPFSQADADKILDVFLKGNTLYQETFTKQQVQAQLDKYLAMQNGELPLSGDTTAGKLPGLIERYSELVKTAPDEGELIAAKTDIDSEKESTDIPKSTEKPSI